VGAIGVAAWVASSSRLGALEAKLVRWRYLYSSGGWRAADGFCGKVVTVDAGGVVELAWGRGLRAITAVRY